LIDFAIWLLTTIQEKTGLWNHSHPIYDSGKITCLEQIKRAREIMFTFSISCLNVSKISLLFDNAS